MDIWFWLAVAFIAVVVFCSAMGAARAGGWRDLLGLAGSEMLPLLLLLGLSALALLLVAITGGNDGWLLGLGLPLVIGILALIAWRFRH